jgi:DNA-binding winged helix-turn-helix (wHTH) protein/class 3 adenylate cyclase/tetratricopeptide (TPR) repeat protein
MPYVFGDFMLDPQRYELMRAGTLIPLRPKVFQVLAYLLAHHDRVVHKEELLAHLWPGQAVGDAALNSYILAVRHALEDSGQHQRAIRTVRGRGYRFVAPVRELDPRPGVAPPGDVPPAAAAMVGEPLRPRVPAATAHAGASLPYATEEYKLVTVVCGALTEAPALAGRLGPEALYRLTQTLGVLAQEVMQHYAGTLTALSSEGFTALFGAPAAQEDHARRAVRAALAVHQRLSQALSLSALPAGSVLALQMGLDSGLVVGGWLGTDSQRRYTAVGAPVHRARRLQERATPGTTLLSAATYTLVATEVQGIPCGTLAVDDQPTPVPVYAVQRLRQRHAHGAGYGRWTARPLVGRQPELAALHRALAQARTGQGQVVALVGEAGVGKSRLVAELVQAPPIRGWQVLASAAVSYGQATPYGPVRDLLTQWTQVEDRDDTPTIQAKVTAHVQTLDVALQETLPALLWLLEALPDASPWRALDPLQRRRQTVEALKRVLVRASQEHPLLLVIEDLHWSDPETQALLDGLVESVPRVSLLLLVTYRPEYQHGWGSKTFYTQLRLDPLSPASTQALLQTLAGHDASLAPLLPLVRARTQGNPFFLEESVHMLAETGVLVGDRGAYRLAHALDTVPVPATVQAVLAARIDRLAPEAKGLLQTAAVIGTEVPWPLLQSLANTADEALSRSLAQLQAAELLYETRLFPERAYTFKHTLTQEVAYGSLLHVRRRVLHARLVAALEAQAGDRADEQVERLAHHAVCGELWEQAVGYSRQAGEKAQTRAAYRAAVGYIEQALAALAHLPASRATTAQAIDLRLALRTALNALGAAPGRILDVVRCAEPLAQTLGDPLRLGRVYADLSDLCWLAGEGARARDYGQRALARATPLGDVGLLARVHIVLGRVWYDAGAYALAITHLERNVALLQEARLAARFHTNGSVAVASRACLSLCHAERGAFTAGRALADDGLQLAETVQHPFRLIEAYYGGGVVALRQGDVPRAIPLLERALGLCQDWHIPVFVPRLAVALGVAYTLAGRVAAGLTLVDQGVAHAVARERPAMRAPVVAGRSEALLQAGRLDEAHTCAVQAVALAGQYQQRGTQAWALWLLGASTAHQPLPEDASAVGHYRQALTLAEELSMRPLQAHCHRGLGMLYATTGQREQARAALSTAIDMYQAMEMTFWLPETEAALAQVQQR